ncbi:VOC family protein [Symbiopectobacterium purcellii]|uniref:VOC family protein n=1 Tax=Symbiopectobacterium purcellii TaxID=2871826 RepID=A0ABX9AP47_9ENTR|nr:VOC family protein [Symbiopectobacterium purcellii]QZN95274.1 VOC family protein [Symbiopectobacterium purcellii]
MLALTAIHHIAIIASDYRKSKAFYCDVLGFELLAETYRAERDSWKGDLALKGRYVIELFSFPSPPQRPTQPESCGLRHLAFAVADIDEACAALQRAGVTYEPVRVDEFTLRRFTFFRDPDGLPLELYEQ